MRNWSLFVPLLAALAVSCIAQSGKLYIDQVGYTRNSNKLVYTDQFADSFRVVNQQTMQVVCAARIFYTWKMMRPPAWILSVEGALP